jgi:hypothetical protein
MLLSFSDGVSYITFNFRSSVRLSDGLSFSASWSSSRKLFLAQIIFITSRNQVMDELGCQPC